jgi:chromosome segregation ATPase
MRRGSLRYHLTLGLLIGILIMPVQPAQAQWTVFDPSQYALQVKKRIEEAERYVNMFDNAVKRLTTLRGVLAQAEDLVAKHRNAITTMSNIGRTVRASYELKDQLEAIITTRLSMLRSIDDRLRRGIFDPEADMRDLDEYLRTSIGRTSQDTLANRERLSRMDNELARWELELKKANKGLSDAQSDKLKANAQIDEERAKPESERCAPCIASLIEKMSNCDLLIAHYTKEIADIRCQIENRVKQYNIQMQERVRFGEQVQSMNEAWGRFNNSLDELQRALSKVN